jgi:ADP-heptose:LPS heptosyltransferase
MKHLLLSLLRVLDGLRGKARPPHEGRRLLFLQYQTAVGSAVHATPVFEAIKRAAPDRHIAVACNGMTYDVLKHNPHIDEVIPTRHAFRDFFRATVDFVRLRFAAKPYDVALTDYANARTKIALLGLVAGVRRRIGFTLAAEIYHDVLHYDPAQSFLDNNLRLLPLIGLQQTHVEPKVAFSSADDLRAGALLADAGLLDGRPVVAFVTQTSGGHPKRWRDDRFAELADLLVASRNCHVVFVGTRQEGAGIETIRALMKARSVSFAGMTTITELAALFARCDLVVTLDTGPLHVARAAGVPGVVVAPEWLPPLEWLPLNLETFEIVLGGLPAGYDPGSPPRYPEFIDAIEVPEVFEAVERLLHRFPPSEAARQARIGRSLTPERQRPAVDLHR